MACRYFSIHGECARGDQCRFSHQGATASPPPMKRSTTYALEHMSPHVRRTKVQESSDYILHRRQLSRNLREKGVCVYFAMSACRNGEKCRFAHVERRAQCPKSQFEGKAVDDNDGASATKAAPPESNVMKTKGFPVPRDGG